MSDSEIISTGKELCGPRYDESIDSLCEKLGLKSADLMIKLGGKEHPEYKKFREEEYEPTMKRVRDYLAGKTDEHPCK